jgi:hypothetical protein
MAGKSREEVTEKDVTGLKYFHRLAPLLARVGWHAQSLRWAWLWCVD